MSRNRRASARRSAEDGLSVLMMTDRKGEHMDRLTTHSHKTGSAVPSAHLGDICLRINGCDNYDFCEGCPIAEMLIKLCAYEDTGLTPEQVELLTKPKLSKSAWTGKIFKNEAEAAKALAAYKQGLFEFPCELNVDTVLLYAGTKSDIAKAMKKLCTEASRNKQQFSGNPQIRVNRAISYLAEKEAFKLKNGKLSIDDSKIPELQSKARNLRAMLIRRIKNACKEG